MNNIEEAKSVLTEIYGEQIVSLDRANVDAQVSQAQALIAIAEQLRISNLIALDAVDATCSSLYNYEDTQFGRMVIKPDIAEALGIKEES